MTTDGILSWFPSTVFAYVYLIVALAALISDLVIARLSGARSSFAAQGRDRGSFMGVYLSAQLGFLCAILMRLWNIGVAAPAAQYVALALMVIGAVVRGWSIVVLGRFFSRMVRIQDGHRLIVAGPYRWIRHPSYTGMLIIDSSIILGLGTWAGALVMFLFVLTATLYRIRVEEAALLEAFGDEYRAYRSRTWRLIPGW